MIMPETAEVVAEHFAEHVTACAGRGGVTNPHLDVLALDHLPGGDVARMFPHDALPLMVHREPTGDGIRADVSLMMIRLADVMGVQASSRTFADLRGDAGASCR